MKPIRAIYINPTETAIEYEAEQMEASGYELMQVLYPLEKTMTPHWLLIFKLRTK